MRTRFDRPHSSLSTTTQWPPLAGPIRSSRPARCKEARFRSMVRSVFPILSARTEIVTFGSSRTRAKMRVGVFPDIFPDRLMRMKSNHASLTPCYQQLRSPRHCETGGRRAVRVWQGAFRPHFRFAGPETCFHSVSWFSVTFEAASLPRV
jgi:hypothetical protein